MSVGVGVSDILFFVNQTLKLYGKCQAAPTELQAAGRNVEQLRTALQILGETIESRRSFVTKQPAIALMIKHEVRPVQEGLSGLDIILNDYIDKSRNMGIIGKLRYAVLDRNKLQSIESSLTKSRTNFSLMLDLLSLKAHEQHARNDNLSIQKLEAILNKQIEETEMRKAATKAREKGDAKLEDILQILQERLPASSNRESESTSPFQVLDQLEKELRKAGLSREKAEAARLNAAQALAEEHNSSPMQSRPHTREKLREQRTTSDSTLQVRQDLQKNSTARKASPQDSTPQNTRATDSELWDSLFSMTPPNTQVSNSKVLDSFLAGIPGIPNLTKDYRILCVDGTHGIRAILAHSYLEVLRAWTANRTGRWLFKRVHSAGIGITTNTRTSIDPTAIRAVKELLPNNEYDWGSDPPHETQRIAQRMRFYNPHGLTKSDLTTYDIILCFTQSDASKISELGTDPNRSDITAKVIVLQECRFISSVDCTKDPKKIKELIPNIKIAIKSFISTELGDWVDGSIERTKTYRTLQFLLPNHRLNFAGPHQDLMGGEKLKEYEKKTGCIIKVTKYKDSMKEVLISIIGPKEHLLEAATLIKPNMQSLSV